MTDANEHWDRSWGQEREAEPRTLEHNLADYKRRALEAERELEEARAELDYLLQTHEATCQNRDEARAEVKRLREAARQAARVLHIAKLQRIEDGIPPGTWLVDAVNASVALDAALAEQDSPATSPGEDAP